MEYSQLIAINVGIVIVFGRACTHFICPCRTDETIEIDINGERWHTHRSMFMHHGQAHLFTIYCQKITENMYYILCNKVWLSAQKPNSTRQLSK